MDVTCRKSLEWMEECKVLNFEEIFRQTSCTWLKSFMKTFGPVLSSIIFTLGRYIWANEKITRDTWRTWNMKYSQQKSEWLKADKGKQPFISQVKMRNCHAMVVNTGLVVIQKVLAYFGSILTRKSGELSCRRLLPRRSCRVGRKVDEEVALHKGILQWNRKSKTDFQRSALGWTVF